MTHYENKFLITLANKNLIKNGKNLTGSWYKYYDFGFKCLICDERFDYIVTHGYEHIKSSGLKLFI